MHKHTNLFAFIFSLMVFAAYAQDLPSSKETMIKAVKSWAASQTGLKEDSIKVRALDRRLQVPTCPSNFDVSFPYKTSQQTVLVTCPDSQWVAYVGIRLQDNQTGFAYIAAQDAGESVLKSSVEAVKVSGSTRNVVTSLDDIADLLLVKNVEKGQIVLKHHFVKSVTIAKLKKDILKGSKISRADVIFEPASSKKAAARTLFPKILLNEAIAARDLVAGTTLSRSDINIRHFVLTSSKAISRGHKINAGNTAVTAFFGKLPKDALTSLDDIQQMETIRVIRAGQPIRSSDLKPSLMIKKGDTVYLSVGTGPLVITSTMVALENGNLDQQIILLNTESNEKVRALVTGPGRARGL
ncbi:MAG: flagellar basal body P-ring formation chaperone FlgA [Porticoccaceae bacterium]|nr:flagellar basal body P-ring formation chaperone FlgA [Porticoccaceae bacterium]